MIGSVSVAIRYKIQIIADSNISVNLESCTEICAKTMGMITIKIYVGVTRNYVGKSSYIFIDRQISPYTA